jgi:hypothetical protein
MLLDEQKLTAGTTAKSTRAIRLSITCQLGAMVPVVEGAKKR